MADSFKKLIPGVNPAALISTEWFSVPEGHEYQGYVRVSYSGTTEARYQIAGVTGTGVTPVAADWEVYANLDDGEVHDLTMDLAEFETLVVYASSADVAFNYRGLDIDNA